MKRILILTNHSFMLWQFRRELIAKLMEMGYAVTIGVPFGDHVEDFIAMGCRMIDTPLDRRSVNPIPDLKLYFQYRSILKELQPDMVITYSIKPNIYGGFACRTLGIPYCVNVQGLGTAFQGGAIAALVTRMYKTALKKARVVFFENQANAAMFRELNITPESQQRVLMGAGINLDFYARQDYPGNDRVHFLYLSRLMREKGIEELFSAVRRLREDGEEFLLDLVGFYEEGYKEQVEELEKLGICRFHGFQMDPRPYYAAADCVVLPSYHEGMSNVLLEAAAIGRPVITSDIPGCREAVIHGTTGYTCPARDAEGLYLAMQQFLALTRTEREEMGLAGHRHIETNFNKKDVVQTTISAIFPEVLV